MCGISGIYHPTIKQDFIVKYLHLMTAALTHRGPDEDGFFLDQKVSLGMRRLKVIDLDTGTQPLYNEDGNLVIVFNGEIYQYEILRKSLEEKGHRFMSQSDTEVLLHLYEEYGLNFFEYFDGMFAFALWDRKAERLLIARDRFGIKPLYYSLPQSHKGFAFASELQSLLKFPEISRALDPVAIDQFFAQSYTLHPRSIYRDIKKLSPGSYLLINDSGIQEHSYWELPNHTSEIAPADAAEVLDNALDESVKSMMRSDVPVGAFLSGGLDSSTVVYYMMRHTHKPVKTFSVRFNETSYDEGQEARLISDFLGTEHFEIWAKPECIMKSPEMAVHFGEPFADPSLIPTYMVSQKAREQVTVALSGDGGDEMLGGYQTYIASLMAGHCQKIPQCFRKSALHFLNMFPASMEKTAFDFKMRRFLRGIQGQPHENHAAWKTIFNARERQQIYQPAFQAELGQAVEKPLFEQWTSLYKIKLRDPLTFYQFLDLKTFLTDNNLTKVDRMSMAHSLEVRIPFLDRRIADIAFRLPEKYRLNGFKTKALLRTIMRDRLPKSIVNMSKKGFHVPLSHWFQKDLLEHVKKSLAPARLSATGIIEPQSVQRLIQEHAAGSMNHNRSLWNLICFMNWFDCQESSQVTL